VSKIESLPFADGSFDAVVAAGVLEYSELERALPELARVLRPGGLAVVSYPNPGNLYGLWKLRVWYRFVRAAKHMARKPPLAFPRGSRAFPPERFRERLAAAGLQPERTEYTSYLAVPAPIDELLPQADGEAWPSSREERDSTGPAARRPGGVRGAKAGVGRYGSRVAPSPRVRAEITRSRSALPRCGWSGSVISAPDAQSLTGYGVVVR